MLIALFDLYTQTSMWSNENQGVVSIGIFAVTMTFGWVSGIFASLRRRPKFRLSLINGPTFCCTYKVGKTHGENEVHRTGIALYLLVANTGSAASSIANVSVGYHCHLQPLSFLWLRYSVGWFWLKHQSVSLTDFQAKIGENIKVFPFLTQANHLAQLKAETFLQIGQSTNGVVYFEQGDSWGGYFPFVNNARVRIKVTVEDTFGKSYAAKFDIPSVSMEDARKYNPSFGTTLAELHGELLPEQLRM